MKIGIIGPGHVGSSVAALLVKGGHEVRFGAREPRDDASLPGRIGTIAQAAAFGNVVLCAAPYGVWPQLARELAPLVTTPRAKGLCPTSVSLANKKMMSAAAMCFPLSDPGGQERNNLGPRFTSDRNAWQHMSHHGLCRAGCALHPAIKALQVDIFMTGSKRVCSFGIADAGNLLV
jgi:hypothetical protein